MQKIDKIRITAAGGICKNQNDNAFLRHKRAGGEDKAANIIMPARRFFSGNSFK